MSVPVQYERLLHSVPARQNIMPSVSQPPACWSVHQAIKSTQITAFQPINRVTSITSGLPERSTLTVTWYGLGTLEGVTLLSQERKRWRCTVVLPYSFHLLRRHQLEYYIWCSQSQPRAQHIRHPLCGLSTGPDSSTAAFKVEVARATYY